MLRQSRCRHILGLFAATCFLVTLTGCGELTRLRLVGKWEADLTEANVGTFGISTQQSDNPFRNVVNSFVQDAAKGIASTVNAKESLELKSDGTFVAVATVGGNEVTRFDGTWEVVGGDAVNIDLLLKYSSTGTTTNMQVELVSDDQLKAPSLVGGTGDTQATFRRVTG